MKDADFQLAILGGMGPWATIHFLDLLFDEYSEILVSDKDFPRTIVDFQTQIPSRSRHVLYGDESPVQYLLDAIKFLDEMNLSAIAIPCNSACALLQGRTTHFKTPILDIIEITSLEIGRIVQNGPCLILGGAVIHLTKTYDSLLQKNNVRCVYPNPNQQAALEEIIAGTKLHGKNDELEFSLKKLISIIRTENDFDFVVLACTELDYLEQGTNDYQVISSTRVLAAHCCKINQSRRGVK